MALASASYDEAVEPRIAKTVTLWDTRTGQELRTLGGFAKTVELWDVRTGKEPFPGAPSVSLLCDPSTNQYRAPFASRAEFA